jgi:hypothetical protein
LFPHRRCHVVEQGVYGVPTMTENNIS